MALLLFYSRALDSGQAPLTDKGYICFVKRNWTEIVSGERTGPLRPEEGTGRDGGKLNI
jgi:hypothetical protein